jgi:hypothetical protein
MTLEVIVHSVLIFLRHLANGTYIFALCVFRVDIHVVVSVFEGLAHQFFTARDSRSYRVVPIKFEF